LEGVPCLFGRYPTQKIPVGIHLVPTGSGRNLWGTVKTSGCIRFINNTLLAFLQRATIELSNRIPAADGCQGFVVNEREDILPRVAILEFKFQVLTTVSC